MAKPIELKGAAGLRNDVSPERFAPEDLLEARNIELDETGKVYRRMGVTQAIAGKAHSLWADGQDAFVVLDGVLSRIHKGMTATAITPVAGERVAYCRVADEVFWTDGLQSGVINGDTSRTWGIEPPPPFGAQSAGAGALREGSYLYTMTFARADGKESGAPLCGRVDAVGGIVFTALPVSTDPTVTSKHIYLSSWGGELPYRAATLANSDTEALITAPPPAGPALRTQLMTNAPAGHLIGAFKGRLYVAQGRHLWYSQPHELELFDPMSGFLTFPDDVQTFAPVSDGIFVGSDSATVFLRGTDPGEFETRKVADYGTVRGTVQEVPEYYVLDEKQRQQGPQMMWMSKCGVCLGGNNGLFKNLTGGRYILPSGAHAGASLLKVRGGTPQLVVSISS